VVSSKATGNLTLHGGNEIRGVIATEAMNSSEILLSIPKSLWMHQDNFQVKNLSQLSCGAGDAQIQAAVAVALEKKNTTNSKWHAYLKDLPTFENYNSFYVRMASNSLLRQFAALPLVKSITASQQLVASQEKCFNEWKEKYGHNLTWQEFQHGLAIWQTRVYGISLNGTDTEALIPASDLLNTGRDDQLNTDWREKTKDGEWHFQVSTNKGIEAGHELYDSYCPGCANSDFLSVWSVYLDDNNVITELPLPSQNATESNAMKTLVQETLQTPHEGLSAPRCQSTVFDESQGPIKCAFARLAWEQFGKAWGLKSSLKSKVSMLIRSDGTGSLEPNVQSSPFDLMDSRGMVRQN